MKKPKIATLRVPAKFYDEGLAFCNERLAESKRNPIKTLPAGYANDNSSCPCASATGVHVGDNRWSGPNDDWMSRMGAPISFVAYFDKHAKGGVLTLPLRGMKARR